MATTHRDRAATAAAALGYCLFGQGGNHQLGPVEPAPGPAPVLYRFKSNSYVTQTEQDRTGCEPLPPGAIVTSTGDVGRWTENPLPNGHLTENALSNGRVANLTEDSSMERLRMPIWQRIPRANGQNAP